MLYYFLYPLHTKISAFNVFKYISFRTFAASITAVLFCMFFGPWYIRFVQKKQVGQFVRQDGPQTHLTKQGTPTMGGGLILSSIAVSTLLWSDLSNVYIWIVFLTTLSYGAIGWLDDYIKIVRKNPNGLSFMQKILTQVVVALCTSISIFYLNHQTGNLHFPFFKDMIIDLSIFFIPFTVLVIVGTSNAVNLTDGLDGLAVGPVMTTAVTFVILTYCAGHIKFAEYLQIPYIAKSGELAVFAAALAASCLGFLWFNTYPAQIFMGDIGALALGAALGTLAVITKNELLLIICGGIFVAEALSVIAQVFSFKLFGKRVFRMAPLHHHFELKGWAEPKVIVRFWIISILLALFSLSTLKLR